MLAIEENSPEIVDLLLKKSARIDDRDEDDIIERDCKSKTLMLKSLINAGANITETAESSGTKLKFLRMAIIHGEKFIVCYLVESARFDMLVDEEILQTAKLDMTLLSQEQLEDQEFMVKLKRVFMDIESHLICGIIRRDRSVKKIDEQWKRTIFSKPVNDFWDLSEYKNLVKSIDYDVYMCIQRMKEHKIGTSTISLFHLWTASWSQLINYAYNKDVREICFRDYDTEYRLFMCRIRRRVNAAIKRSKLLEKSSEKIFVLLKTLPFSCCQQIVTFLDDDELEIFNTQFEYIDEYFSES